jgi:single-strand DNA-binding protein
MAGEATVEFVGNVGGEPELRFTPGGDAVCSFSVAVTPRVKRGDEWEDGDTTWFRVSAWRKDAEALTEVLRKGDRVRVVGALRVSEYQKRDGTAGYGLEVAAVPSGVGVVPRSPKAPSASGAAGSWGSPPADDNPPF